MINDFYTYIQEQDEDDIVSYSFVTNGRYLYYVYFDPYQYVTHVDKYPHLLTSGYGFGFQRMSSPNNPWAHDPLICNTISKIIFDFIQQYGDEVVLLYHCDYSDRKQRGRDRIFEEWYSTSPLKQFILKKRVHVTLINKKGEENSMFMGYLTSAKNNYRLEIEDEFTFFAEYLGDKP